MNNELMRMDQRKGLNLRKMGNATVAVFAAIGIILSGKYVIDTLKPKDVEPTTIIDNSNKKEKKTLDPNLKFDPDSNREMIDRCSSFLAKSLPCGINNITEEQIMDFYLVMNIDNITPEDMHRLRMTNKTKDSIIRNFDIVCNILAEDIMTMEANTIPEIDELISDKTSSNSVDYLLSIIASYNSKNYSEQKEIASDINNYIDEFFLTSKHLENEPSTNILLLKLVLGMSDVSANNKYRILNNQLLKELYGSGGCNLASKSTDNSVFNKEKTKVKQILESKLEAMNNIVATEDVEDIELLTAIEISIEISELVNRYGYNFISNPSITNKIDQSAPTTNNNSTVTAPVSPKKPEATPQTPQVSGKAKIRSKDASEAAKSIPNEYDSIEEAKENVENDIEKYNNRQEHISEASVKGYEDGFKEGFYDAENGHKYNSKCNVPGYIKSYARNEYNDQYKKGYEFGWKQYKPPVTTDDYFQPATQEEIDADRASRQNTTITEEIVVEGDNIDLGDDFTIIDGDLLPTSSLSNLNTLKAMRSLIYDRIDTQSNTINIDLDDISKGKSI